VECPRKIFFTHDDTPIRVSCLHVASVFGNFLRERVRVFLSHLGGAFGVSVLGPA